MTLTEFLLARIAEDETAADRAGGSRWDESLIESGDAEHIARHDPARVLAECAAKRRIVQLHAAPVQRPDGTWRHDTDQCTDFEPWPCETVRVLAAIYSDHPDFDESWRP